MDALKILAKVFLRVKRRLVEVFACKGDLVEVILRVKETLAKMFECKGNLTEVF